MLFQRKKVASALACVLGAGSADFSVRKGAILWFVSREREGRRETVLKSVIDPDSLGE